MKPKSAFFPLAALLLCGMLLDHPANAQTRDDAALAARFKGSAWRVSCDQCDRTKFSPYYMFLNNDMKVGYNFSTPANYDYSSYPANWSVRNGQLLVEWKHGDTQRYPLTSTPGQTFSGLNQHGVEQVIVRVEK
jgi:hypothetical protein